MRIDKIFGGKSSSRREEHNADINVPVREGSGLSICKRSATLATKISVASNTEPERT